MNFVAPLALPSCRPVAAGVYSASHHQPPARPSTRRTRTCGRLASSSSLVLFHVDRSPRRAFEGPAPRLSGAVCKQKEPPQPPPEGQPSAGDEPSVEKQPAEDAPEEMPENLTADEAVRMRTARQRQSISEEDFKQSELSPSDILRDWNRARALDEVDMSRRHLTILFVCNDNVSRSMVVEGVMNCVAKNRDLSRRIFCFSAGTDVCLGDTPHPKIARICKLKNINLSGGKAMQITRQDLDNYDLIVAMDATTRGYILMLLQDEFDIDFDHYNKKVVLLGDFIKKGSEAERLRAELAQQFDTPDFPDIPNPLYCRSERQMMLTVDVMTGACNGLLDYLLEKGL
eukprot:tig00000459_g1082.t1